jgi:Cu(I)-responsive transcriptional regulator
MNIGTIAAKSGVSAKSIRYYESIGLITRASRSAAGYRTFSSADLQALLFIRRARTVGFSIDDIAELLALWRRPERASADVRAIADRHRRAVEAKIAELADLRDTLDAMIARCAGDSSPHCAILDRLGAEESP